MRAAFWGSSGMQRLQKGCKSAPNAIISGPSLLDYGTASAPLAQLSLTFTTVVRRASNAGSVCKAHANILVQSRMIRPASRDGEEYLGCLRNIGIELLSLGLPPLILQDACDEVVYEVMLPCRLRMDGRLGLETATTVFPKMWPPRLDVVRLRNVDDSYDMLHRWLPWSSTQPMGSIPVERPFVNWSFSIRRLATLFHRLELVCATHHHHQSYQESIGLRKAPDFRDADLLV
ncbi:hypothetical protein V8C44DRAFT_322641 [Trichoderma aethiopicum]